MKTQKFMLEITDITGQFPLNARQISEALQTETAKVGVNYHINVIET
jgi:hypothetical protein